ncbi:MAG: DUF1343 domain-containing protein [Deltaproteobacteria bacterium]|nr:DUF1343 domain-containing protein [Deltaproteobacteria bacterium]
MESNPKSLSSTIALLFGDALRSVTVLGVTVLGVTALRITALGITALSLVFPSSTVAEAPVQVGLENFVAQPDSPWKGKRLGLVAHSASVGRDGRHAIDLLRKKGFKLVRVFSPEHGLRGQAAAGQAVPSGRDPATGLPVVSLYGVHKRPQPADLEGLDALLFDLQGAGVRFYTYVSTLIYCLEAAAEANLELVVLDRPNPLGGNRIEGPVSAPRDMEPASFVNLAPGPLVHGLTLGEMAKLVNSTLPTKARLTVVPMKGWQRSMIWKDTGLLWVPPSPNLTTANTALVYPGTALLEATNVSEGRGTDYPFQLLGAPWLERSAIHPSKFRLTAAGFNLQGASFQPEPSPAALEPKHAGKPCLGLRVIVVNGTTAEPYRLGLRLVQWFSKHTGFAWLREGQALTRLLGTPKVYDALAKGTSIGEILAADEADHMAWRKQRKAFLLYE